MAVGSEAVAVPVVTLVLEAISVPPGFPVDRFLAHWWVFPASILFSLVALASGVSGALFFILPNRSQCERTRQQSATAFK